jgi:hypothetical protein
MTSFEEADVADDLPRGGRILLELFLSLSASSVSGSNRYGYEKLAGTSSRVSFKTSGAGQQPLNQNAAYKQAFQSRR